MVPSVVVCGMDDWGTFQLFFLTSSLKVLSVATSCMKEVVAEF